MLFCLQGLTFKNFRLNSTVKTQLEEAMELLGQAQSGKKDADENFRQYLRFVFCRGEMQEGEQRRI